MCEIYAGEPYFSSNLGKVRAYVDAWYLFGSKKNLIISLTLDYLKV